MGTLDDVVRKLKEWFDDAWYYSAAETGYTIFTVRFKDGGASTLITTSVLGDVSAKTAHDVIFKELMKHWKNN